jgi:plasmid stabilization system protein ParE
MRAVYYSPESELHLQEIKAFSLKTWGKAVSESYFSTITQQIDRAARKTLPGHYHPFVPEPYRVVIVGKHLALIEFDKKSLRVLAIVHHFMDLPGYFEKLNQKVGQ